MLWQSALESAIQVAIAIVGFSGIVAAVGRRGAGHWTPADQLLLRILLTSAGVGLVFAFLPFVLVDAIEPDLAWRVASGLVAVWTICITVYRRLQAASVPASE